MSPIEKEPVRLQHARRLDITSDGVVIAPYALIIRDRRLQHREHPLGFRAHRLGKDSFHSKRRDRQVERELPARRGRGVRKWKLTMLHDARGGAVEQGQVVFTELNRGDARIGSIGDGVRRDLDIRKVEVTGGETIAVLRFVVRRMRQGNGFDVDAECAQLVLVALELPAGALEGRLIVARGTVALYRRKDLPPFHRGPVGEKKREQFQPTRRF